MGTIRIAALLALVESLLVTRLMSYGLLPQYQEDAFANAIWVLATILTANLSSLILWWTVIDPTLRSPFRRLPRPKVSPRFFHQTPDPENTHQSPIPISFQWLLLRVALARFPRTELLSNLSRSIPNNGIFALWGRDALENIRQFMTRLLGSGLEGEPHKVLRKSSLQAFGHQQMEKDVGEPRTGGVVDMASWAYKIAADVIGIAVLGRDFGSLGNADDALIANYKRTIRPGLRLYRILAVWLSFEFAQKPPWKKNEVFNESTAVMKKHICRETLLERKEIAAGMNGGGREDEVSGDTAGDFDPRRRIDADGRPNTHGGARSMCAFATFLHDPRSCIGMQFAKAELRCLIAALASRCEWSLAMADEDVVLGGVISITPFKGLRLRLRKVEGD
ncbi:cytochrome P450 [Xylaria acuta]|nr:cytochrome P450 [Xylaria acuta]